MLGILDLFDVGRPFWTSEQIMETTGFSRPTTFRYLKELRQSGLLARFGGGYVLGAKAVKFDYIIRQSDPLLHLFQPILARLCDDTDCGVILATLLGEEFFSTVYEQNDSATVNWSRGTPMPLTRGAGGLAVLAAVPAPLQKRLLAKAGLEGEALANLKTELKIVAKQGYAVSLGALDPNNAGIAVPVLLAGVPPAALVLVMSRKRFQTSDLAIIVDLLRRGRADMVAAYNSVDTMPAKTVEGDCR
ncbi:helix-turn-helix domain-containing protein [Sphingomonas oligophenolica]|uniref:Helix-turn-helix domain-containing protein n=1 Tax=Sphingomonas oligophenolica TaxID=301154 RepID=A0ABU9YBM4_9SPHN